MSNDDIELNTRLAMAKPAAFVFSKVSKGENPCYPQGDDCGSVAERKLGTLVQWTTGDDKKFVPSGHTQGRLPPGVYEIKATPSLGVYFERISIKTEGLVRFPQTNSDKVIREIQTFWDKEALFREYDLTYKRGILLWGPPGSGKTSCLQIIMADLVERAGVIVKFGSPDLFLAGMRMLREVEVATPVIVLMEDIDSILQTYSESDVLNILDGVDRVEKILFLATTNFPEKLGERIVNRPSRFDKRLKIGLLDAESRGIYFRHLIGEDRVRTLKIDLKAWVRDTDGFSIAHLKELFVAVVILGDDYDAALTTLKSMKEKSPSSENDYDESQMGFSAAWRNG